LEILSPAWAIGLTVALIGILGAFAVQRFVFYNQSAANFRKNFDAEQDINIFNGYTIEQFKKVFAIHKESSRVFSGSITGLKRRRFDKTWNEYEQWANKIFTESAHTQDGVYKLTLAHEGRNTDQEFKNHMNSLLKFAK